MLCIIKDNRPIRSLWGTDESVGALVDCNGVTKIEPYLENGQMAAVTWFAVWKGDTLVCRINGAHVSQINYEEEKDGTD